MITSGEKKSVSGTSVPAQMEPHQLILSLADVSRGADEDSGFIVFRFCKFFPRCLRRDLLGG